jgi:hypothetical protein
MFGRPWQIGFILVLATAVVGELLLVPGDYVFHRLGVSRDALLLSLWVLPVLASFVATYYSKKHKLLSGLSFLVLVPLILSAAHYLNGELGGVVDFTGLSGAVVTLKVYFAIGSLLMIPGIALGLLLPKRPPTAQSSATTAAQGTPQNHE